MKTVEFEWKVRKEGEIMYKDALQSIIYGLSSIILCAAFVAILEGIKKKLLNMNKKYKEKNNSSIS